MISDIWNMTGPEVYEEFKTFKPPYVKQDIGKVTMVCHISNQAHLLPDTVASARAIADEIIILDDCSIDNTKQVAFDLGCRVFSVPEGWIYTHGFGALIGFGISLAGDGYHLQLDAGERLWVRPNHPKLSADYYWTRRINMETLGGFESPNGVRVAWDRGEPRETPVNFIQMMPSRLVKASAPLNIMGMIHCVFEETFKCFIPERQSQILIFQEAGRYQNNSDYYKLRKKRLYNKLSVRAVKLDQMSTPFWDDWYKRKKNMVDQNVVEAEAEIGVLELTDEPIEEAFSAD